MKIGGLIALYNLFMAEKKEPFQISDLKPSGTARAANHSDLKITSARVRILEFLPSGIESSFTAQTTAVQEGD